MKNAIDEMSINKMVKAVAKYRGLSLGELCKRFNANYGTNYSVGSFRNKLNYEKGLSYNDVQRFGEILGFTVNVSLSDGNQLPICQSS